MEIYENYQELLEKRERAAVALLELVGEGDWQKEELYYHESKEDFAEYELTEGWYADMRIDRDQNGAPNLLDYIDTEALAKDMIKTWDDSCNCDTWYGIVQTQYGW